MRTSPFQKILLLFISIVYMPVAQAQHAWGIKYFGLSVHPKGEQENAFLMPRKLDKNAVLVVNIGGVVAYEKVLIKDVLSLKVAQAFYSDCAARPGGFSHVGLRGKIIRKGNHSLEGGIGPTLVYRKNWLALDGYVNRNRFKGDEKDKWQYLFLWYGGEFEYKYTINNRMDFAASFIPGYPDLMSLSFGVNCKL